MSIKDILSGKNDEAKEYFWALIIEPGWVQAGVWRVNEGATQIISFSPATAWELDEELVGAADTALSAAVQNFPEDAKEPSKAVFGVISSWVSEGEIKAEYLKKIKELCSELSLTPVGFVVLPEAIAHYVKSEEGSPLNGCVLGISKEEIEVSVFRLGKLVGSSQVTRSISIYEDTIEGLARFAKSEPLPSRFILYDGKEGETEEARQSLLKANWDDVPEVKFLHTPKIETFNTQKKIEAVSLAGASELADVTRVVKEEDEEGDEREGEEKESEKEEVENVMPAKEAPTAAELGFVVGEDVTEGEEVTAEEVIPPAPINQEKPKRDFRIKTKTMGMLNSIKEKIASATGVFRRKKAKENVGKKTFSLGIIFFVLVVVGIFAAWWFYPKATVTIYLSTKKLEEKVDITIDPQAGSSNFSDKVLKGEQLETTVSGEKTKQTSGTKTVGEQAKGEITLYRVGSQISLNSGTTIVGPGNLEFTLDNDATVASGSAVNPGKTNTAVTASTIGAQYNLSAGTTFSVRNYSTSDIEAKNENAFSGGSSREISAVSAEDQKDLEEELTDELKGKAEKEFMDKVLSDSLYIAEALTATSSAKNFSDKVGDEASTLKLSMTENATSVSVKEEDVIELAKEALQDKIPEGYVLRSEQVDLSFDFVGVSGETYEMEVHVSANLLPEINPEEVRDKIIGKYPKVVENYLKSEISGFSRAEITFNKPRFPGRLGTLPRIAKNIDVEIAAAK